MHLYCWYDSHNAHAVYLRWNYDYRTPGYPISVNPRKPWNSETEIEKFCSSGTINKEEEGKMVGKRWEVRKTEKEKRKWMTESDSGQFYFFGYLLKQSVFADVKYLRTEVVKVAETAEAAKGLENLRSNTEVKDLEIQIKWKSRKSNFAGTCFRVRSIMFIHPTAATCKSCIQLNFSVFVSLALVLLWFS